MKSVLTSLVLCRHWVDKNCLPWSKQYFKDNLLNKIFELENTTLTINEIDSVSGDCDVTQRKGKVKCLYDMTLKFSFKSTQESEISGTIEVPEFVHDQLEDELFIVIQSSTLSLELKHSFTSMLKEALLKFQPDLIEAHEQDIKHNS